MTLAWLVLGCDNSPGGGGFGKPLIFPNQALLLGHTVAMSIDSNMVPGGVGPLVERYDLSAENVSIQLTGLFPTHEITTVDVFDAGPTHVTTLDFGLLGGGEAPRIGTSLTVVVFDLPDPLPGASFPVTITAQLLIDGVVANGVNNTLTVVGTGGAKTVFNAANSDPSRMAPRPSLRLVPLLDTAGVDGFSSNWGDIGGIEFTVEYDSTLVTFPSTATPIPVVPLTGGSLANAAWGPVVDGAGSLKTVRVVMVNANGMTALDLAEGPMVDIEFDKVLPFNAGDFDVQGLKVFDLDGVLQSPPIGPTESAANFFQLVSRVDQ